MLNRYISYKVKPSESEFKIGIKFVYKKRENIGELGNVYIELGPLNLGDPCIQENSLIERDCNKGEGSKTGCVRDSNFMNYSCNCEPAYSLKPNCREINYCKMRHDLGPVKGVCFAHNIYNRYILENIC